MKFAQINLLTTLLLFHRLMAPPVYAGVVNPDISAIGQVFGGYTDEPSAAAPFQPEKFTLSLGETELDLDASLNPFFKGTFVVSVGGDGEIEVEEASASMVRGLPFGLALRAGKYRLNFGKLNQAHPHAYPFIRTPRVLSPDIARLLPGEESFNDIAVEASTLLPVIGSWAMLLSADFLEGKSFHPQDASASHAGLVHLSNTFGGDGAAFDIGVSAAQGTNNVEWKTKTTVIGADAKTKIAPTSLYSLTIGAELLGKLSKTADTAGVIIQDDRYGFYIYADTRFFTHYNAGVLYEQYQDPDDRWVLDRAIKPFVGFSVFEESTVLRISYEYCFKGKANGTNTLEVQLLFSMGPHKAHQF